MEDIIMNKEIKVHDVVLHVGDVVNTIDGQARLEYIGRQAFTSWKLLDLKSKEFPFGRDVNVEDNNLDRFII